MEDNRGIAIYHVVYSREVFEKSANTLFELVRDAQLKSPNKKRVLYLDIEGHKNKNGGFDNDMLELQKDFIAGILMKFLSEVHMPLGSLTNPKQINEIPAGLNILPSEN